MPTYTHNRQSNMVEQSLGDLVRFCVERYTSPAVFRSLLKHLKHEITTEEVCALFNGPATLDPLVVMYILEACVNMDQTTNFKLAVVLTHLSQASGGNQVLILTSLIIHLRSTKSLALGPLEFADVIRSLVTYLTYLLKHKQDQPVVMETAGRLVILLGRTVPHDVVLNSLTLQQNECLKTFLVQILDLIPDAGEEVTEFADRVMRKDSVSIRQSISQSAQQSSVGHASFIKTSKVPKLLWLNYCLENWKTHSPQFLSSFDQFVKVKTSQNVLNELLTTAFEGYLIAQQETSTSPYYAKNWKLFLLKRVPILISELKLKSTESSLVSVLGNIVAKASQTIKLQSGGGSSNNYEDMFSSFPSTVTDIRHEFIKSCTALQLLPESAFATILKQDAAAYSGAIRTNDDVLDSRGSPIVIESTFRNKLIDINPEFTSLEDSGLLEFLQAVNTMEATKQIQVAQLIISTIEDFIKNDDTAHLYRLSMALSLSLDALHAIIFHVSPKMLLKPIMKCLDKWQVNSEEANFQENHAEFGCIFLLFMLIVKEFNISLSDLISLKETPDSTSFCINYLLNLGSSSGKNIATELNPHKSEVINGWMSALFDSGGISDDLMRVSNVQECFELFPIIFQQAFIACKQNLTDLDVVKGGLEYFLQPSLLATVVGIVSWCEDYLWRGEDVDLIVGLLKALIAPMELSGESVHIHRVIISIFGAGLYKSLSAIDLSTTIATKIDPVFLSNLHQSIKEGRRPKFFEVETSSSFELLYSESGPNHEISLMNTFNSQFQLLITWGQSSAIPPYDHRFLSNMMTFLGVRAGVDYFLNQVANALQSTSKSSQVVLELASFILIVPYVGFSSQNKHIVLTALKTGVLEPKSKNSQLNVLLYELTTRKASYKEESPMAMAFQTLYDKIVETAQQGHTLE